MRHACITSPGRLAGRDLLLRERARPRAAALAFLALVVSVSGLAVTGDAHAQTGSQELGPAEVTIEAVYPTAIAGLEDLVFSVTVGSAPEEDLLVPVTLSPGILSAIEQRFVILILAGSTGSRLSVSTRLLMEGATTGDVTATVGDGDDHDVGEPSAATVTLHVGGGVAAVTVGFSAPVYRLDESVGTTTDEIRLIARTNPGSPVARRLTVPVWARGDTATSADDYTGPAGLVTFSAPWTVQETLDGDVYSSEAPVPVGIVDDDGSEGDERFTLWVGLPTDSSHSVSLAITDSAPECDSDGCGSYVIITDNDGGIIIPDDEHSGDVTIEAEHPTALEEIDDLVFTVTRSVAAGNELAVPVTLSTGILAADKLSHTVTIPVNETSAELTIATGDLDPNAATGDVTATVGDGDMHDVGEASTATVRVYVGGPLVTIRLNAASYILDESIGTTTDEISLIAMTEPGIPAPINRLRASLSTMADTAGSSDDYRVLNEHFTFEGGAENGWAEVDDFYRSEVQVPLTILDDSVIEGSETFQLLLERAPSLPGTVILAAVNSSLAPCEANRCEADVTIVDNDGRGVTVSPTGTLTVVEGDSATYSVVLDSVPSGDVTVTPEVGDVVDADISVSEALVFTQDNWDTPQKATVVAAADGNRANGSTTIVHSVAGGGYGESGVTAPLVPVSEIDAEGRTVVTLVHVPDLTTFDEDEPVLFRLLFEAADGGRAQYGADVELSFEWTHHSPIVPTSGQITRIVLSLPRVDAWDSAVQILDNDIGNPDGTVTVRITGCERNGCIIGEPSEITATIADDNGGPAAAPPGNPDRPRLVCAASGDGYDPTGIEVSWSTPAFVGGAPIEGYEVQYQRRVDDSYPWVWGEWQPWPHAGNSVSTTITGLEVDSLYGVRVRAVNANGSGQWSLPNTFWTGYSEDVCEILDQFTP